MNTEEKILSLEREALDQWSNGNPAGFAMHSSDDATYIDDIGAQNRIEGKEAAIQYLDSLKEAIPSHKYEMVKPKVQTYGDSAVLSYWYHPTTLEGEPGTKWRASVMYSKVNGDWQMVHAQWTMLKEEQPS